jgi:hypothetical protein
MRLDPAHLRLREQYSGHHKRAALCHNLTSMQQSDMLVEDQQAWFIKRE